MLSIFPKAGGCFQLHKIAMILWWLFFTITTTIAHWVEPAPFYLFVGRWYQMVFLSKNPPCYTSATNMEVWLRLASVTLQPLFFGELKEQHIQLGSLALKEVCWALPRFQWNSYEKTQQGFGCAWKMMFFSSNIWNFPASSWIHYLVETGILGFVGGEPTMCIYIYTCIHITVFSHNVPSIPPFPLNLSLYDSNLRQRSVR